MSTNADKILDSVKANILGLVLENPTIHYNKAQLARHAGVPRDALYDRLDTLLSYGILEEADVGMDRTHYKLNTDSQAANAVAQLLYLEGDHDN